MTKTLHQMTRLEMKAHQKALRAKAQAIHMGHLISGCQCCAGQYNPFDLNPICETMETHSRVNAEFRRVRNFRMVRYCQDRDISVAEFQERFGVIFEVMA
jgi:hypothetical protein